MHVARIRLVVKSVEIQGFLVEVDRPAASDEAPLAPRHSGWMRGNLASAMREAHTHCTALPGAVHGETVESDTLHMLICGIGSAAHVCGTRWLGALGIGFAAKSRPAQFSLLVTDFAWCLLAFVDMAQAWPTSRRFGEEPQGCRWGCNAVGGDDLRHYLGCLAMWDAIASSRRVYGRCEGGI